MNRGPDAIPCSLQRNCSRSWFNGFKWSVLDVSVPAVCQTMKIRFSYFSASFFGSGVSKESRICLAQLPKLRTRVRFPSPASGSILLPRLTKSLQTLLLAFAIVRHYSLLFAISRCRSTVATGTSVVTTTHAIMPSAMEELPEFSHFREPSPAHTSWSIVEVRFCVTTQ